MFERQENYYPDEYPDGSWFVASRDNFVRNDGKGDGMDKQEATDLAWAYNKGAHSDDEAVEMVIKRDGKPPDWIVQDADA